MLVSRMLLWNTHSEMGLHESISKQWFNYFEGTLITPSLVSSILNICQDLFKYQYKIAPQTLKDFCVTKIYYNKLNEDLLPRELKIYCRNVVHAELPVWYPQWTVPSVFIRHLDFIVSSKEQTTARR